MVAIGQCVGQHDDLRRLRNETFETVAERCGVFAVEHDAHAFRYREETLPGRIKYHTADRVRS